MAASGTSVEGTQRNDTAILLAGSFSVAVLAIITELGFGALERHDPQRIEDRAEARPLDTDKGGSEEQDEVDPRHPGAARAAHSRRSRQRRGQRRLRGRWGGPTITVGSKNFTEQYILGELYAQALAANGFSVEKKLDLGSEQIADKALQNGQIDMYPEYTGTSLVAVLGYKGENPPTPEATYQKAKELYAKRDPADTMLTPAQFNNTYGIFVRSQVAEQDDLKTLTDLAEVSRANLRILLRVPESP